MKYPERSKGPLMDATQEQMIEREPVLAFSIYLSGRVDVLHSFADEIRGKLDQASSGNSVDGELICRAGNLMWFWILGAYEVVRTMCQSKNCFSPPALAELSVLKKDLAEVRMPAAKMEHAGKPSPVTSNRSPVGWCRKRRDLRVSAPGQREVFARDLLEKFERVFCHLTASDVIRPHEEGYNRSAV